MDMVPEKLPADWQRFINNRVLEHSIFYKKEENSGYCTHCRGMVAMPTAVNHNMPGTCPGCGASVTYKNWKKQKHTTFRTTAALLQRCKDGEHYVYRQFFVDMYTERGRRYVPEISAHEGYRQIFRISGTDVAGSATAYEWAEFRRTGIVRWCDACTVRHGMYSGDNHGYKNSVLYTGNMAGLLRNSPMRYIPAADIVKSMGREKIDVMAVLGDMRTGIPV